MKSQLKKYLHQVHLNIIKQSILKYRFPLYLHYQFQHYKSNLIKTVNNSQFKKQPPSMNKNILLTVVLIILAAYVDSATFGITSVSTCTQQTTSGFCLRWQQNGSVTQTTTCFPATTQLYVLEDGVEMTKNMSEIKVGDKVLGFDGTEKKYSQVIGWLHKKPEATAQYLEINTHSGSFLVSASHNIALMDGTYLFASELQGQHLHNGQPVQNIESKQAKGVYAPFTSSGNFYVRMGQNEKTLAHCFANVRSPELYEPIVSSIFKAWEFFEGKVETEQIHPAASWMMDKFNFLVQE